MTLIVSVAAVREYMKLETNNPTGSSQYTDATISSNVLAAQDMLEQATARWWVDRPTVTWTTTTENRPVIALPGFRSFTSIAQNSTALTYSGTGQNVWPISDPRGSGLYTALQFRAFDRGRAGPAYMSDPLWWDKGMDSPYYRAASWQGSAPADLVIAGAGGYLAGSEPNALLHAVKVLASFYTMRPNSILADVAITPQGGVLNYSEMPGEVTNFIKAYRAGTQVISV